MFCKTNDNTQNSDKDEVFDSEPEDTSKIRKLKQENSDIKEQIVDMCVKINNIKNTNVDVKTIDTNEIKGNGSVISTYEYMDENNKEAADVMATHGMKAAVEFMTKGMSDGTMSYAEMRSRYG